MYLGEKHADAMTGNLTIVARGESIRTQQLLHNITSNIATSAVIYHKAPSVPKSVPPRKKLAKHRLT